MILLETPWSPAKLAQVIGRALRPDAHADGELHVHLLRLVFPPGEYEDKKTVDDIIADIQEKKEGEINAFLALLKKAFPPKKN